MRASGWSMREESWGVEGGGVRDDEWGRRCEEGGWKIKFERLSVQEEGSGGELGSGLDLDPDPWNILWIRIRQNDADPLDPDLQHCCTVQYLVSRDVKTQSFTCVSSFHSFNISQNPVCPRSQRLYFPKDPNYFARSRSECMSTKTIWISAWKPSLSRLEQVQLAWFQNQININNGHIPLQPLQAPFWCRDSELVNI